MPADGLLAGAAVEVVGFSVGVGLLTAEDVAGDAARVSTPVAAGEATDTTDGLREGGAAAEEDTRMSGTLLETDAQNVHTKSFAAVFAVGSKWWWSVCIGLEFNATHTAEDEVKRPLVFIQF